MSRKRPIQADINIWHPCDLTKTICDFITCCYGRADMAKRRHIASFLKVHGGRDRQETKPFHAQNRVHVCVVGKGSRLYHPIVQFTISFYAPKKVRGSSFKIQFFYIQRMWKFVIDVCWEKRKRGSRFWNVYKNVIN